MPHREPDGLPYADLPDEFTNVRVVYVERPSHAEATLLKWVLGVFSALLISFVIGGWNISMQVSGITRDVQNLKDYVRDMKRMIEPQRPKRKKDDEEE